MWQDRNHPNYVFVSENSIIDEMQYLAPLGSSDHVGILWKLKYGSKEKIRTAKNIKKAYWRDNYLKMGNILAGIDWEKRKWKERTLPNAGRASRDNIWKRGPYVYRM